MANADDPFALRKACHALPDDVVSSSRAVSSASQWRSWLIPFLGGKRLESETFVNNSHYRGSRHQIFSAKGVREDVPSGLRLRFETWEQPLTLGQPLPTLSLWLSDDFGVELDLEES